MGGKQPARMLRNFLDAKFPILAWACFSIIPPWWQIILSPLYSTSSLSANSDPMSNVKTLNSQVLGGTVIDWEPICI
jgi:hypothetical protein